MRKIINNFHMTKASLSSGRTHQQE